MPGPKAKKQKPPELDPIICGLLDGFAFSNSHIRHLIEVGRITEAEALALAVRCQEALAAEVGRLPPRKAGRPISIDNILRRLSVAKAVEGGMSVTDAATSVAKTRLVIQGEEGQEVRPVVSPENFLKNFYSDRARFGLDDAYIEFFLNACAKYENELKL